jgi:hypothetical protein
MRPSMEMWGFYVDVRGTSCSLFFWVIIFCSYELQRHDTFSHELSIMTFNLFKLPSYDTFFHFVSQRG